MVCIGYRSIHSLGIIGFFLAMSVNAQNSESPITEPMQEFLSNAKVIRTIQSKMKRALYGCCK
jgi:hypothetical protein